MIESLSRPSLNASRCNLSHRTALNISFGIYSSLHIPREEVSNLLHIQISLLVVRHVAGLRERKPLHLRDAPEERHDDTILSLVIATVEKKSRNFDLVKLVENRPRLE